MNSTQRKYLVKRVEDIANTAIKKLNDQHGFLHSINRSDIIRNLKNWRPLTKKEILKKYEDHSWRSLDDPIVYDENEYKSVREQLEKEIKTKNKTISNSIDKIRTKMNQVKDTIMMGNETESLKMLEDFTKFISNF